MDLEILSINPIDSWSTEKKNHWHRLQILCQRILEKGVDVTNNFSTDFFIIKMTFGMFAEVQKTSDLFHQICSLAKDYDIDQVTAALNEGKEKTKLSSLSKFIAICRAHGVNTKFGDDVSGPEPSHFLPKGVDEEFFDTYGFFEKANRYYKMESVGDNKFKPRPFTNFKMEVLFHMNNGPRPKRTIQITNMYGASKRVDVDTDKMVSKSKFKELVEGLGNFLFTGSDGNLDQLKAYLYNQERSAYQINELGWQEEGFWAWSNGIFDQKFHLLDNNGYVELKGRHYIVPAGNHDEPGRIRRYNNQIRFRHFGDQHSTFKQWSKMYHEVFPINGAIVMTFAISCLFSDIVFNSKQFFPLLMIYGEGGSGKGSAIKMAQRLFGVPQDPMAVSSKANTDKARVAILAQFINSMLLLEEYTPGHDVDQFLKNMWDRYGYKRRTMDATYNTETVPIQSGVAVTSNFTPSDDPLLQRLIFLRHNKNEYSAEERERFNDLIVYSERGITACTHELLSKRKVIEERFREVQLETYKEVKSKNAGLAGCTDRMIENISVLIAIFTLLQESDIPFPFTREYLIDELVAVTVSQNEMRDSSNDVQHFFNIFNSAVQIGELLEDVHYSIVGNHLRFNLKQVYLAYSTLYRNQEGKPALSLNNMRDKLTIHPSYSGKADSINIGKNRKTSAMLFHYDKIGVDLVAASMIYSGSRKKRSSMNQSYEDKINDQKGDKNWDPVDGPPM